MICKGCVHHWYGDVSKTYSNFKTWWCRYPGYERRLADKANKEREQEARPNKCNLRKEK